MIFSDALPMSIMTPRLATYKDHINGQSIKDRGSDWPFIRGSPMTYRAIILINIELYL